MKKSITSLAVVFAASTLLVGIAHAIPGTNPLPRTGQGEAGKCYNSNTTPATEVTCAGTRQDGETRKGVAWPGTRFTNNNNGTVTDNLTGLIWMQDITCLGTRNWDNANALVAVLQSGSCGLSDGSTAGMWRMPNVNELGSLVDLNYTNPALTAGHPFVLPSGNYSTSLIWSSTLLAWDSNWTNAFQIADGKSYGAGGSDDYGSHSAHRASVNFILPVKIVP